MQSTCSYYHLDSHWQWRSLKCKEPERDNLSIVGSTCNATITPDQTRITECRLTRGTANAFDSLLKITPVLVCLDILFDNFGVEILSVDGNTIRSTQHKHAKYMGERQ